MNQDLFEKGPVSRAYFTFSIPLVLSLVVTMLYNIADTYFIARTQNTDLIAGVSLGAPVFTLLMAFGNIYAQGGCSLVSRLLGKQADQDVRRVSAFCSYTAIFTGVIVGAIMLLFRRGILTGLGANEASFSYASEYYIWLAIGAPLVVFSFVPSNFLRSAGLSRESMVGSISGTVVNIILDPIMISVWGWGATGAAVATVLGYVVTDVYFLYLMLRRCPQFSLRLREAGIPPRYVGQIMGIGIPAAVTNLTTSLSMVLTNQRLLPFGNDKIAAMGIVAKVVQVAVLFLVGFSFGAQPIIGYLYGAGNRERLKQLTSFSFRFLLSLGAFLGVSFFAAAPWLIRLFLSDEAVVGASVVMLRLQAASLAFVSVVMFMTILAQSTGQVVYALMLSLSRQGVVFVVVLVILSRLAGYTGVIATPCVADTLTAAIAAVLYFKGLRPMLAKLT